MTTASKRPRSGADVRYVDADGAAALLAISRSAPYREVKRGRLPKPTRLNARVSRWRVDKLIAAFERG